MDHRRRQQRAQPLDQLVAAEEPVGDQRDPARAMLGGDILEPRDTVPGEQDPAGRVEEAEGLDHPILSDWNARARGEQSSSP
jgi:hypothetical protein